MKITSSKKSQSQTGYALLLTMAFVTVTLMTFASLLYWVSSNGIVTQRNNLYVTAQAAAESATENVITAMMRDFTYGALKPTASYQSLVPNTTGWPIQFSFKNTNGVANRTTVNIGAGSWTPLPSQFAGLYGFGQTCVIASQATTVGQSHAVSSTVSQSVWYGSIPLFQFAIFYNLDLEINPGAAMTINGRVHCNQNIWATGNSSGSPLTFGAGVDATGTVTNAPSPLDNQNSGHRSGNVVYADVNSPVQNSDSLILPIGTSNNNNPTNITAILKLPPSTMAAPLPAAYSTNGQVYLYNAADLVISNSVNGVDGSSSADVLTVYYQNPNRVTPLAKVAPDQQIIQNVASNFYSLGTSYTTNITKKTTGGRHPVTTYKTNIVVNTITNVTTTYFTTTNYYYSFVTNLTFYDYRESKTVQAVQVSVAKLNSWLANNSSVGGKQYQLFNTTGSTDKGHGINSIYVYSNVDMDNSTLPAVRLTDGAQLPSSGLTVATPLPLYVKGDYNVTKNGVNYSKSLGDTVNTFPAALLGDAITILSDNWSDAYTASTSVSSRNPANVCINAATLEGIVPSNGSNYSGGVENFLRLLENWSGRTVTYNGSIVVMFPSQYATSPWGKSNVYNAANRQWGFDTNFINQNQLPPLTPQLKATVRGSYGMR